MCDVRLRSTALCSVEIEQAPKCPQWCKQYDSHSLFNVPTRVGCINTMYLPRAHNGKIKISLNLCKNSSTAVTIVAMVFDFSKQAFMIESI